MNMAGKFILGLIVVALGILVGWYVFGGKVNIAQIIPKPIGTIGNTLPKVSPTSAYTYTEVPATGLPSPSGTITTKGGVVINNGQTSTKVEVKYGDSGFLPVVITVKSGSSVTFTNTSASKSMWVYSDPKKSGLTGFDETKGVGTGGTYTYTFKSIGTWKYFNHLNTGDIGTVIVTQ
jgi:plastocyanin